MKIIHPSQLEHGKYYMQYYSLATKEVNVFATFIQYNKTDECKGSLWVTAYSHVLFSESRSKKICVEEVEHKFLVTESEEDTERVIFFELTEDEFNTHYIMEIL